MIRRLSGARACAMLIAVGALLIAGCGGRMADPSGSSDPPASVAAVHVPGADWGRFNYDAQRSGVGPSDTGITAGDVSLLRRRVVHLDGTVDSSAIELHAVKVAGRRRDVIVVTTTYGRTVAIDPGTGKRLWEFVPAHIRSYEGTAQVTTATPIADPGRRYVFAASPDGFIHKLSISSGRQARSGHWPARVTYDATHEKIASALNISGRSVVVVTGGYIGDSPPYQGHLVLINRSNGRVSRVWNALCSNRHYLINPPRSCPASDAAIWARAGAVIEPGSRRILVATGNAPFNGSTDWGDSVLELAPDASHALHNWTPINQAQLEASDTDLGSTAPALLPRRGGLRLAVQGGKDQQLHLLDLDRLNGTTGGAGRRLGGELQNIAAPGPVEVFTAPAVWRHDGRVYVFVADNEATAAYVLGSDQRLHVAWQDATPGTSPVVAGGLLYVYDEVQARLVIRRPIDGRQLASLRSGGGHWNSPIVVGGRIIEPEGNYRDHATRGTIDIYHLPGR